MRPITVQTAASATQEWLATRKAWWSHYFDCIACRCYHRQPVQKRGANPCMVGEALEQTYNNEPMWHRKLK